jgi:transposase
MAKSRLSMRKIKEILRLKADLGLSDKLIAESVGSARSSVQECLRRARVAGMCWPQCQSLDEQQIHAIVYKRAGRPTRQAPPPDFEKIHAELGRKGMTRELLWQEYKYEQPLGVQYTTFCNQYRAWLRTQETVFRQQYLPGDKLFVDYSGQTVPIVDRLTGEVSQAQIFVAVLGFSNYTFAEASGSQSLPDWLGSHVRALKFFGGSPRVVVPDNLRSGVTKAHRYDPDINPAYAELAQAYGVAVLPARVRKPRDKAKVEVGVQIVQRWILARLRHQTFFSVAELNLAIAGLLQDLNQRPFKKKPGSRQSMFIEQERGALAPLPPRHYEYARWKQAKVHPDYHVQVERSFYSVPYQLVGQILDARIGERMLELFSKGKLVASHHRQTKHGHFHTLTEHLAPAHTAQIEQSMVRMLRQAGHIGEATRQIVANQAASRKHPEQTLRAAQGIVRLAVDYSPERLEEACQQALIYRIHHYRGIRHLIESPPPAPAPEQVAPLEHENLRGSNYFH